MKLKRICELLNCKILSAMENFDELEIKYAGAADLMSDVLAFGKPGMLLITGLNSPQAVRTASVIGATAVLIVRKETIPESTVELAKELGIILLHSNMPMFKACGELYKLGLKDPISSEDA
ncbi:hypothetical protein AT15_03585 [Kosmotoga arenicorallina S304]|uniref:DRTGG domain-containing protein n=1 Tax=Kosmotoga arenicorallina S304 TaxID=1453497 RepID=A0A182C832_9BACT|nr:hypothetical protein [Kosmotoga arenicorallina]OAA31919.1 hypothetical protein AT15_03585 [Kosmotoga arenicorallina S304]